MPHLDPESFARHFKALSHPRRVRIFHLLADTPEAGKSFLALRTATGLCRSSLAHHLREMELCGLIRRRRRGPTVAFALQTGPFARALAEAIRIGTVSNGAKPAKSRLPSWRDLRADPGIALDA